MFGLGDCFEAGLIIALLLCWQLRLLPSWSLRLTAGKLFQAEAEWLAFLSAWCSLRLMEDVLNLLLLRWHLS
jgi:hypothetical protein